MSEEYLTGKQPAFVVAFVDNELAGGKLTLQEVAVKAGVAARNAPKYATETLQLPKIQRAIAERKRLLAEEAAGTLDVDAKRVLREWAEIAIGDPTEIVTVRRLNCRHCWGFQFGYQYTDAEYAKETAEEMESAEAMGIPCNLDRFGGGNGFRHTRDPNPACPECDGEGVEDVFIKDLRKLTDRQRRMIAGVKNGKFGIEVIFRDQDAALKNLAQWLGLVVNKNEHTGANGGPIQTQNANVNYTLPSDPVEAAKQYQLLMEGKQ
jgi:phage terminase small subunit